MRYSGASSRAVLYRLSFSLRLFATVVITVGAIGAVQYVLADRHLTQRVVEQAATAHRSDARVLQSLHEPYAAEQWTKVSELLGHIAARPGVRHVAVADPDGRVAVVGMKHSPAVGGAAPMAAGSEASKPAMRSTHGASKPGMKMRHGAKKPAMKGSHGAAEPTGSNGAAGPAMTMGHAGPAGSPFTTGRPVDVQRREAVARVIATGRVFSGDDPARRGAAFYVVPVDLATGRHALVVVKEDKTLRAQLADIQLILLLTLGIGALIAFPMFYVLGGRSLTARYRMERLRSSSDALTALGNHRSFHEDLRRQVEIAQRRGGTVSLAVIDVDHFKQVNDTFGHAQGDAVLMRVAELLSGGRAEDGAYRIGGDEFAVILPNTSMKDALIVLERVRCRVAEELDIVTTSIGVAELGRPAADAQTLLACADLALYEAKDAGRNRVCTPRLPKADRRASGAMTYSSTSPE